MKSKDRHNTHDDEHTCVVCFNSLGVDSRMEIYKFLKNKGPTTVTEVVRFIKLTQPTVSYHLKAMKDAGILDSKRHGKEVHYSVNGACPTFGTDCVLKDVDFPD